ncbi:MAG: T9SS type A sorting domain-containing protein [Bacteroidales bacterium]|nr:T9SS type A sorting domain-containing protein [Bacteroidales bacterium]
MKPRNYSILTFLISIVLIIFGIYIAEAQTTVTLNVNQPAALLVDAGIDVSINEGESATLGGTPTATGGYGDYSYLWSPSTDIDNPALSNPLVTPASTTIYSVSVTDAKGCTNSDNISITVIPQTGLTEKDNKHSITLFPNPVRGLLSIRSSDLPGNIITVYLLNSTGQIIFIKPAILQNNILDETLDLSGLPKGSYIIKLENEDVIHINHIILQ